MNVKKELIDQSAHAIIGFAIAYGIMMLLGPIMWSAPIAFLVVVIGAFIRELVQHDFDDLGYGSLLDMIFWSIGAWLGAYVGL